VGFISILTVLLVRRLAEMSQITFFRIF